jgi:K+-transporting ATPase KdpF subunit
MILSEERMLIGKFVVAAALIVAFAYLIYVLLYPEKF